MITITLTETQLESVRSAVYMQLEALIDEAYHSCDPELSEYLSIECGELASAVAAIEGVGR